MNMKQRIEKLRNEINKLIEKDAPQGEIYKASAELDELIKEYYKQNPDC